jgi:hypothetical protein
MTEVCTNGKSGDWIKTVAPLLGIEFGLEVDPSIMKDGFVAGGFRVASYLISPLLPPRLTFSPTAAGYTKDRPETSEDGAFSWDGTSLFTFKMLDIDAEYVVGVYAGRSNAIVRYDDKSGKATFKKEVHPTEIMQAEIYVFLSNSCLTSNEPDLTPEKILDRMRKETKPGVTQVLIDLSEDATQIITCVVDNVTCINNGKTRVETARK